MGIDPTDDDYEAGAHCILCEATLFNGVTPKYVWANVVGIEQCPGMPVFPGNGFFKLTQGTPCYWFTVIDNWVYRYYLVPGRSGFEIEFGGFFGFFAWVLEECLDQFSNQFDDCIGGIVCGKNGSVDIWWGPNHPCEVSP